MFATFSRVLLSRRAIALAGATTTAIAFNRSMEHKRTADEVYKKFLQEQGAVTELKQQLRARDAALTAALDLHETAEVSEEGGDIAVALSALAAITSLVGFCMIATGKGAV